MKTKEYAVPRAVKSGGSGDNFAREEAGAFFYLLVCGHRSLCKTRKDYRGKTVAVPRESEVRDCAECRKALLDAGKPIPPCPMCKGANSIVRVSDVTNTKGHRTVTHSKVTCPWCKGRSAPPVSTIRPVKTPTGRPMLLVEGLVERADPPASGASS